MKCPNCAVESGQGRQCTDWQSNTYEVCIGCGCWFQNPPVDVKYEEQYWGIIKDPDGKVRDLRLERESRLKNWYCETVQFVNDMKPGRILDVGAGLGFFLSAVNANWERHALDVSAVGLKFIQERNPDIICHHGILDSNSFSENAFDCVMAYHVIEHVSDPRALVADIYRILKPGGVAIFGTPNIRSISAYWFKGRFRLLGNGHLCLYHPHALRKLLKGVGLNPIKTVFPFFRTDYARLSCLKNFVSSKSLSPAFWGNVMNIYARK